MTQTQKCDIMNTANIFYGDNADMTENKQNFQIILDNTLEEIGNTKPKLLLHSCCGPCSSYVLEYLSQYFNICVLYFNPCIYPENEYQKRVNTQKQTIDGLNFGIELAVCDYDHDSFLEYVKGHENEREGSARCSLCYRQRLEKCADYADENGFDYFCTTLSVSPYKNAQKLNAIGEELAKNHNAKYLFSDFKKKNGYKRSIELSKELNLYRQEYCGCEFSLRDSKNQGENNLP